jgi:inorganic pyrophosphatase
MNTITGTFLRRSQATLARTGIRAASSIVAKPTGAADTEEFAIKFFSSDKQVSPWHDIALEAEKSGQFNFLCEIPKMTKAKMEVNTKAENNPIVQDIKKVSSSCVWCMTCCAPSNGLLFSPLYMNKIRYPPYLPIRVNSVTITVQFSGITDAYPRPGKTLTLRAVMKWATPSETTTLLTWLKSERAPSLQALSHPSSLWEFSRCSTTVPSLFLIVYIPVTTADPPTHTPSLSLPVHPPAIVRRPGELDWKVIAINAADPLADQINNIDDVDKMYPGTVSGIREWFRWYKTPDNKPINAFGYGEKALGKDFALKVIEETHHHYNDLINGKAKPGKLWIK